MDSLEHVDVETFAEYLLDDERETFDHNDLMLLGESTHKRRQVIRQELEGYGFRLVKREREKNPRGFNSNCHDRWSSCPCHGGSGWEQIFGFGGQEG